MRPDEKVDWQICGPGDIGSDGSSKNIEMEI